MDSFVDNDMQFGETYIAPDPDFISAISFFSSSLPWDRFKTFFDSRKLVGLNGEEQLTLLRFLAVQELLCLDDQDLLRWLKNQFYLFSFLQPDFKPRLPTIALLKQFRSELDKIGLLEPFRKHCQHIIAEHGQRFPAIKPLKQHMTKVEMEKQNSSPGEKKEHENTIDFSQSLLSKTRDFIKKSPAIFGSVPSPSMKDASMQKRHGKSCENCGSFDFIRLKSSQEESSLPAIRFIRCRVCGNTTREK